VEEFAAEKMADLNQREGTPSKLDNTMADLKQGEVTTPHTPQTEENADSKGNLENVVAEYWHNIKNSYKIALKNHPR